MLRWSLACVIYKSIEKESNMETSPQNLKRNLQVKDFNCRRCRVQATCEDDHICGICKAVGKCAGPNAETISWQDLLLAPELSREVFLWFKSRKPI